MAKIDVLVVAALASAILLGPRTLPAQQVRVGVEASDFFSPLVTNGQVYTTIDLTPANLDGSLTFVSFGWSASPCFSGVKIKVFRPSPVPFPSGGLIYAFVAERGPFSIPVIDPLPFPSPPFPLLGFTLDPPIPVERGDVIGIANVTACGGPVHIAPYPDRPTPMSFSVPGDVTSSIFDVSHIPADFAVMLFATGPSEALGLLGDRFAVTLTATDPRTHQTASGAPFRLGDGAGFFALPDFTGDSLVPEITVKMVDATRSPALGGGFWFFYAPLTDAEFVLTVKDQSDGAVRTYRGGPSPGGSPLCGAADTSAFGP